MHIGDNLVLLATSLGLFQLKHFIFDFPLQTRYQLRNKGIYGHPGGILHAGLHVLGSIPAIMIVAPPLWLAALLLAGEFGVHYHMDWTKEQVLKKFGWTSRDYGFWQALGFDQMVHHLTYISMAYFLFARL